MSKKSNFADPITQHLIPPPPFLRSALPLAIVLQSRVLNLSKSNLLCCMNACQSIISGNTLIICTQI